MLAHLIFTVLMTPAHASTPDSICELTRPGLVRMSSRQCMGCHDGSIGTHADVGLTSTLGGSHPVEMDYESARLSRPSTLVPAVLLPRAVSLDNGRVTCTSCHDVESTQPKHLSVTMEGSALCQTCHAK